ncbi:hypothetical protein NKH77_40165 [Streptomyces sp. M19]
MDGGVRRRAGGRRGRPQDLVAQFSLPPHVIRSAAATVRRELPGEDLLDAAGLAWRAGLAEARMGLDELGRRIEPEAGWSDLVLPERQVRILREIVAHVRQRATVYQEWVSRGRCGAASASPRCSRAARAPARPSRRR